MLTTAQLQELACPDCPASVHGSRGQGLAGLVLVVVVEHEPTCPFLARSAPQGATLAVPGALLRHVARETP